MCGHVHCKLPNISIDCTIHYLSSYLINATPGYPRGHVYDLSPCDRSESQETMPKSCCAVECTNVLRKGCGLHYYHFSMKKECRT